MTDSLPPPSLFPKLSDEQLQRLCECGSELNQVWTNLIDNVIDAMKESLKSAHSASIGRAGRDCRQWAGESPN